MPIVRCAGMGFKKSDGGDVSEFVEPISKEDFEIFCEYVQSLCQEMYLKGFETKIMAGSCETGYVAEVDPDFNYRRIKISLCPQFHTFEPARKRTILVHELLHAHMTCVKMPYAALEEIVSSDVWTTTEAVGTSMEEHTVTAMEWAFAPHMPLPPAITGGKGNRKGKAK